MHLVAWPYNVEPWLPSGNATGTTCACLDSIAGSKDGIDEFAITTHERALPDSFTLLLPDC